MRHLAILGLVAQLWARSAWPAPRTDVCFPVEVASYQNRIHLECAVSLPQIRYFAVPSTDPQSSRLLDILDSGLLAGQSLKIEFDPADTTTGPAFGCAVSDCRPLLDASVLRIDPPATRPSDVFFTVPGDPDPKPFTDFHPLNKKDGRTVVARGGVVVRGWLKNTPHVNVSRDRANGVEIGVEDIVDDLFLDADFIANRYGNNPSALSGAMMPGNPFDPATVKVPVEDKTAAVGAPGITVNSFWLPNSATAPLELHIELNAWHRTASSNCDLFGWLCWYNNFDGRGDAPAGWINKEVLFDRGAPAFATAADTWWPFDPEKPDGGSQKLKAGDYVEVGGTLWQDGPHQEGVGCWGRSFKNHEGWLEIHPIDMIRRVPPPPSPSRLVTGYPGGKAVVAMSLCADPDKSEQGQIRICPEGLSGPGQARDTPVTRLLPQTQELIDGRFTDLQSASRSITTVDDCVEISADVLGRSNPGRFKASYVVSWVDPTPPPPQASLTVFKVLKPSTDAGRFNLQIDGSTRAADVGDAGSTGPQVVGVGQHTVGETAGTGTNLASYRAVIGGACARNGSVTLADGDDKTCTITNTGPGARAECVAECEAQRVDCYADRGRGVTRPQCDVRYQACVRRCPP